MPALCLDVKIPRRLQVHPDLAGGSEGLGKIQRGCGRDATLATDELVQARTGPAEARGKCGLSGARMARPQW
jgi:hypothetical protein